MRPFGVPDEEDGWEGSMRRLIAVCLGGMLATLALASPAFAAAHHPTGEFAQFGECPLNRATITDCVYSVTTGGSVTIGKKTVPIKNPVTLQGGFEGAGEGVKFYGAEEGGTLSKTPQPVPGGLLGLLNCQEQTNLLIKGLCATALENGLTGVNATVELAGPSKGLTGIKLNTLNLLLESGTALGLPVKFHLENPLLGSSCYVGSDSKPVQLNLTSGSSGALNGSLGELSFNEEFTITRIKGAEIVDGTFAAPEATGCGGLLALVVNPVVNLELGTPAGSGSNAATLIADFEDAASSEVRASE
jgi:hypothetical protein